MFAFVRTIEELSIEQLYGDYGENKLEQYVHDENVDDIFQRIYDAIEYCFQFRYSFDGFQGPQDAQDSQRFDRREILTCAAATVFVQFDRRWWIEENITNYYRSLQQFHNVHGKDIRDCHEPVARSSDRGPNLGDLALPRGGSSVARRALDLRTAHERKAELGAGSGLRTKRENRINKFDSIFSPDGPDNTYDISNPKLTAAHMTTTASMMFQNSRK